MRGRWAGRPRRRPRARAIYARDLDVGASHNYQDHVTVSRDGVGRETTDTHAAQGADLLEVRNTTAGRTDLLAGPYTDYSVGHPP